jgi:hypothetical protein
VLRSSHRGGRWPGPHGDLRYAVRHKVHKPPALENKVAYDGRLNAQKALAAIGGLVD